MAVAACPHAAGMLLAMVACAGIGGAGLADARGIAGVAVSAVSAVLSPAIAVGQLVPLLPLLELAPNASAGRAPSAREQKPTNKGGRGRPGVRVCQNHGCQQVATFGDPAGGGPVVCRAHRTPTHRSMRGWTPCLHAEGCKQKGSFGFRSGRPLYCQEHKSPAHVSLSFRGRTCLFRGCSKQPSFGSSVDRRIRFCREHKGAGDMDLRLWRCRHPEGCLKAATFASPSSKVPTTCAAHRLPYSVRVNGIFLAIT